MHAFLINISLFFSPSQSVQTARMSSGIMNTRWIWRLSAAAHFTASCSNRACLSPHSWDGSPPRSVAFLFPHLVLKGKTVARDCCGDPGVRRDRHISHPSAFMPRRAWVGSDAAIRSRCGEDGRRHLRVAFVYFQVRELYQGVLGKLPQLHPRLVAQGTVGEGYRRIKMEVEREAERRKTLGSQLKSLLESQLEVRTTHTTPFPFCYKK